MPQVESSSVVGTIEKRGSALHLGAIHCTGILHVDVAKVRWPKKTAFHWAAAAGVKERIVKYWMAGTYPVSADGKLALIRELQ